MRATRISLIAILVIGLAGTAGTVQASASWAQKFGTPESDEATSVAVDGNGDTYLTGWTMGTLPRQTSSGTVDAFLRKYTAGGDELWTRQFGSWERDFARAVSVDGVGNAYVVGETHGTLPGQASAGSFDAFVRKYDSAGNELWTRQLGGGGGEGAWGATVDREGNVYLVGTTGAALPGHTSAGSFDAFVAKYDALGNEVWTRQFGGYGGEGARAVALDSAGGVLVVGSTDAALPGQAPAGGFDAYLRRYDAHGNHVWSRQFGSEADDYGMAVAVEPGGRTVMVGSADRALPGQVSAGGTDAFVRSFDFDGTALWTEQFGTAQSEEAWGVATDSAGDAYVVGSAGGLYVRKFDSSGRERWTQRPGFGETDLGLSISLDPEGHPGVAGSTTAQSAGGRDAFIIKLG